MAGPLTQLAEFGAGGVTKLLEPSNVFRENSHVAVAQADDARVID